MEDDLLINQHLNQLLIDSLLYPTMLISKDKKVLAANREAREAGAEPSGHYWQIFGHSEFITYVQYSVTAVREYRPKYLIK